jgi:hypothetical protein
MSLSHLEDKKGQSTIEYLLVCFILIGVLLKGPGIYHKVSSTMENKYHSYAFSVAISDPPRKAFDDEIRKDAAKVEHVLEVLEEIEDDIEHAHIPDIRDIDIPKGIEKIWEKITHLF